MPHPDEEVLAGLALGEDAPSPDVAAHVAACPTCAPELAALRRVAALARQGSDAAEVVEPPAGVWDRITAEIGPTEAGADEASTGGAGADEASTGEAGAADPVVVDLDAARVRRESGAAATHAAPRRAAAPRRRPWGWAMGAAAAGAVVGLAGGWVLWNAPEPAPTVVASTPLGTLDTSEQRGDAEVLSADTGVALAVSTEPLDAGEGFLEVWLINRDLQRMISVGVLQEGAESATFPIEQRLLDEGYVIVDISREGFDDRPEHSGDSVVRGTLPL